MNAAQDRLAIDTIRALAMDAVQAANSGHPGTPMSLAPLGHLIFSKYRRHDPAHPDWPDRDRFVLSAGHASMLQYALLHLTGYDLPLSELRAFRQWGSKTPGHPEFGHTAGVETTTGPLGQGVANAVGMAMAEVHLARRFNRPGHTVFDHRTFCIAGDGCLMEGVSAEAASLAGHLKLSKLILFWDDNRITIDGSTELAFSENVSQRFEAYGWHVQSVADGNDLAAIGKAIEGCSSDGRPHFIRVRTVIGDPSPGKKGTHEAHGAPLGADEVKRTKEVMGWPLEPTFHVPTELATLKTQILERGQKHWAEWQARLASYRKTHSDLAKELDLTLRGELPAGWADALTVFPPDPKGQGSRKASQTIIADLAKKLPNFVGGSADLANSNLTYQKGQPNFVDHEGVPRNVHFGVREHGMGGILNGMAAHGGLIPYGATFFVFTDYMRPAIRLAALMGLPVRYVFTHDSIGLGEDGPTHQPIEHLAALRAIPGLVVLRPADANETREAWKVALRRKGPAALVLSRQNLPTYDRGVCGPAEGTARGAYILFEAEGGRPDVLLLSTGGEVGACVAARELLLKTGVKARVVSMPSWEIFQEQEPSYRESVLPAWVKPRVVVEAGTRFGWERFAGERAAYVTLERFGASAPAEQLFARFGFTAENIAEIATKLVRGGS